MTASSLHIVICNERLLPRFGVDRLLLLLGGGLTERGHRITFLCQRGDKAAIATIPSVFTEVPDLGQFDLHGAEAAAVRWLSDHWDDLSYDRAPDVVVTGGWPFFNIAKVCAPRSVPSLFIDAGAVPHDGMPADLVVGQRELRRVRARALPGFTAVLPISDFIRDSQTLPERGSGEGVHTVLLGADHLESPMFSAPSGDAADAAALAHVKRLAAEGYRLVGMLGRFESEGYKNSPAVFDVFARVLEREPDARLLLLARPDDVRPPDALRHAVVPLGFVSDVTLGAMMQRCALGLSMSRWEGFNLPLAEMQWYGRPVLAFNLAAHPEVTADPWLLCDSVGEMADKAVHLLERGLPPHILAENRFEQFRNRHRWRDVIERYVQVIEGLAQTPRPVALRAAPPRRVLLVDCTNAAVDPANPGVIRVTRRLGHALQQDSELLPIFARWDGELATYRLLNAAERTTLASYAGPSDGISSLFSQAGQGVWPIDNLLTVFDGGSSPVLFLPEVVLDGRLPERIAWARARGMLVAAILYDLIPVTHPPFCSPSVVGRFPEYLEGLAATDAVYAISRESLRQFELYLARHSLPCPPQRDTVWLPAQFGAHPRATALPPPPPAGTPLIALCVSSIDPRKNHRNLIAAFRALLKRRPHLPLRLVLVGHRFGGADDLADWVTAITREEPRITWLGLVSDDELAALFERAAFSVFPSLVEGFGLPVVESLWMGRPCLCHSDGVMAELAADGGCLTVDMSDAVAIEHGLERLAGDAGFRLRLTEQVLGRMLSDWASYGTEIGRCLRDLRESDRLYAVPAACRTTCSTSAAVPVLRLLRRRLGEEAEALIEARVDFALATNTLVSAAEAEHR